MALLISFIVLLIVVCTVFMALSTSSMPVSWANDLSCAAMEATSIVANWA